MAKVVEVEGTGIRALSTADMLAEYTTALSRSLWRRSGHGTGNAAGANLRH